MSLVTTRIGLIHRMTTDRAASGDDGGGGATPVWEPHLVDQPCRAWTDVTKQAMNSEQIVVVTDARISVPLGTDVRDTDRVASVRDRTGGDVLYAPLDIQGIAVFSDHLELLVQQGH